MVTLVDSMTGDHPARPCLVLSNTANAAGLVKSGQRGVKTAVVDHRPFKGDRAAFETRLHAVLADAKPDIICLAGFMRILTPAFIQKWQGKMLNIHPSLLPKYPGLHTHARALANGDTEHGCTVHKVTEVLDHGPMLGQGRVPVRPGDTPDTLAGRVLKMEHLLYPAVLRRFAQGDASVVYLP